MQNNPNVVVRAVIDGDYLCTQCLGAHQRDEDPVLFVLVSDGEPDAEEYACRACAIAIAGGAAVTALRIAVEKE